MDGLIGRCQSFPLSFEQESVWRSEQLNPSVPHHATIGIRLRGKLQRHALIAALDRIVARHEVLRTVFPGVEGVPLPVIESRGSGFALIEQNLSGASLDEICEQEANTAFDLSGGPLIRGRLLKISREDHVLLISLHEIIGDNESLHILVRELTVHYAAFALEQRDPAPELHVQYKDLARWRRQQSPRHAGADSALLSRQAFKADRLHLRLPKDLTQQLRELAQRQDMSLFMMLLSAWAVLVGRWGGQDEVVIGTPVTSRNRPELQPLIGSFENKVPLHIALPDSATVDQLLRSVCRVWQEACAQPGLSFDSGRSPVFNAFLEYRNSLMSFGELGEPHLPDLRLSEIRIDRSHTPFELSLFLNEQDGGLAGTLEYAADRLERNTVEWMATCFENLLWAMVGNIHAPIGQLQLLSAAASRQVLHEFNRTATAFVPDRLIHELFEDQVARTPDAHAAVYEGQSLTYAELNRKANRLARYLREAGVGPDQPVCLCVERSLEMITGLLGILKAGGAYVPLDPGFPTERRQSIQEDAGARIVLTQQSIRDVVQAGDVAGRDDSNLENAKLGLTSGNLAYVIYTSGSTGQSKGVMVEHRNVANLWFALEHLYRRRLDCRRVAVNAPFTFDSSVKQLIQLLSGCTLFVVPAAVRLDARALLRFVDDNRIDCIDCTPLQLKAWLAAGLLDRERSLRAVLLGGEAIDPLLWNTLARRSDIAFYNVYGPTECTVDATAALLGDAPNSPSIGRPISNVRVYILDSRRRPVPIGMAGEIHIGGRGVARGYLNQPELTARSFITDPFSEDSGARLYKTGDLGRWRADGTIEFLGRNDFQVKVRGYRIELGEIESRLARHEQIKDAVVVAREDVPGEKRLVAYLTRRENAHPSIEELRSNLKKTLPEYMIPSAFVFLDHWPLNSNGKLDRRALPAPELDAFISRPYEAPRDESERALADIWRDLLRVEKVGREDNFFELGGHSLLIAQMMERLRAVSLFTEVRHAYESPTLKDLARTLTAESADILEIPPSRIPLGCQAIAPQMLPLVDLEPEAIACIERSVPGGAENTLDIYPLAPLQEGILFQHLLNEEKGDVYVLLMLVALSSRRKLDELIAALQAVIDRHDVLRTAILWEQLPQPVQVVYRRVELPVDEITLARDRNPVEQMHECMRPERQKLDLRRAPLMRLKVAADPQSAQWYALLQTHHLICDNESLHTMVAEVMAHFSGTSQVLPPSVPYRDHVWQALSQARKHDATAFFKRKLQDIDEPTAPFGLVDVRGDGSRIEQNRDSIEPELTRRIRTQARRLGVSAATLFHAAWALVVAGTSGRNDVVFGSVLLGRMQGSADTRGALGMFINTLPLRLRLEGITALDLVKQTQRELVQILDHEQASLAEAQRCSGIAGSAPLFSALLNYRHTSTTAVQTRFDSASGLSWLAQRSGSSYPVVLSVDDDGDGFLLELKTDRRIDPRQMMGYTQAAVHSLVEALERSPHSAAQALSILSEQDRRKVVETFNLTETPYPREKLIHELFEAQAQRAPNAIAVVCGERQLTYAQLNSRANQLARVLVARGVRPDDRVCVYAERSVELVVGLLAILKAGGGYVPLDLSYPAERLVHMVADSQPVAVLTQSHLIDSLPPSPAVVIALDGAAEEIEHQTDGNLDSRQLGLRVNHLAYIIYTSGSTGTPKGVMVEHRNVGNLIHWHCAAFSLKEGDRSACVAAMGFDAAVWEIWPPLSVGATLVLASPSAVRDPDALLAWWAKQTLDLSFLPTPMAEFAFSRNIRNPTLRTLLVGGDRLRQRPESQPFALVNNYGPTESTVVATSGCIHDDDSTLHIGRPIANTRIYILDSRRCPVPVGVAGEIYIGGASVARGYLNRPELTEQRFIPDPFSSDPQSRMYRTGDLARWQADGTIEYVGRNDEQVKIRGFRIELGEIEALLSRHAALEEVVVLAREDKPGEKSLVAYFTQRGRQEPGTEELRAYVKASLPEYMIPSAFVRLEQMPLTPNGKLDKRALPAPALDDYASRDFVAPEGEVQKALAEIWRELLRIERVGQHDHFFDLGGHSILAMQLIVRIRAALSIELPMSAVFDCPTLQQMAARLDELRDAQLLESITSGADDVSELLKKVASMPESKVRELMKVLRTEGRS